MTPSQATDAEAEAGRIPAVMRPVCPKTGHVIATVIARVELVRDETLLSNGVWVDAVELGRKLVSVSCPHCDDTLTFTEEGQLSDYFGGALGHAHEVKT